MPGNLPWFSTLTSSSSASRSRLPAGSLPSFAVWQATQLRCEDRLDVAVILDVDDAVLRDAQAGLVVGVPLLLRLVARLVGDQRRRVDEVPHLVVRLRGERSSRSRSAAGCGRGSRRSRCGSRPAAAGARSAPCSAPCRRLSSVWKVKAMSAGIFARKLVSGLPSGSSGCFVRPSSNLRTGISPRMRSRSLAWL